MTTLSSTLSRVKAFFKKSDNRLLGGAFLFLVAAIAADGLSTALVTEFLGGMESNPFMRDFLGRMLWPNFFIIKFMWLIFVGGGALLLRRLSQSANLTALYMALAALGDMQAAIGNLIVAARISGLLY